jgi:putative endonuclease
LNGFLQGCRCRSVADHRHRPPLPVIPSAVEGSRRATKKKMKAQNYFVYILTNGDRHTVLYIGVTNNLEYRASEHSLGRDSVFAKQYNANKLVYFDTFSDPQGAIAREKQLKNWSRAKKEALIGRVNPEWRDLLDEMYSHSSK